MMKKARFQDSHIRFLPVIVVIALAVGGGFGWIGCNGDDSLHPDTNTNYGPEGTAFRMIFWDKINFQGDGGTNDLLHLWSFTQNDCHNIKDYRTVSDGKSVELWDYNNPDSPLPVGMKVYLYWGKNCNRDYPNNPYGVITVPENTPRVKVPRLNHSSLGYEAFNIPSGDRKLNGHVYGLRWYIP